MQCFSVSSCICLTSFNMYETGSDNNKLPLRGNNVQVLARVEVELVKCGKMVNLDVIVLFKSHKYLQFGKRLILFVI